MANTTDVTPPKKKGLPRWLGMVVGLCVLIAGGAKLAGAVSLPACDSSTALDSVRDIFLKQTEEAVEVTNAALVSDGTDDRNCSAHIKSSTEQADITYRVYWDGWSKMVQIGEVNVTAPTG